MDSEESLREHVSWLLQKGNAHVTFERAIDDLPAGDRGRKPSEIPHSPWRLLEHLRICQWDILEFSRDPDHLSPQFPDGYWPNTDAPPKPHDWDESVARFQADLLQMIRLVTDPATDLHTPIPHGEGQTILEKRCWWQTTTRITLDNWCCYDEHWGVGQKDDHARKDRAHSVRVCTGQ